VPRFSAGIIAPDKHIDDTVSSTRAPRNWNEAVHGLRCGTGCGLLDTTSGTRENVWEDREKLLKDGERQLRARQ
jgi:hypothetical protein